MSIFIHGLKDGYMKGHHIFAIAEDKSIWCRICKQWSPEAHITGGNRKSSIQKVKDGEWEEEWSGNIKYKDEDKKEGAESALPIIHVKDEGDVEMKEYHLKVEQRARQAAQIEMVVNKIKLEMGTWLTHLMNAGLSRSYAEGFIDGKESVKEEAAAPPSESSKPALKLTEASRRPRSPSERRARTVRGAGAEGARDTSEAQ